MATVSSRGTSESYRFIKEHGKGLRVSVLCQWFGVSKSGYYDWLNRKPSKRKLDDAVLGGSITEIYEDSDGRYGSPKVHKALRKRGIFVGKKRVERIMRELGLVARVVKVTRRAPGIKRYHEAGENLRLAMDPPESINEVWVADITYIKVKERWSYLSVIMDLYSRRIIGWSLDKTRATDLTVRTLRLALRKRTINEGL